MVHITARQLGRRYESFKVTLPLFGGASWSWAILWNPGIIFIIVGLITIPLHGMNGDTVKEAWKNSFNQVKGAAMPFSSVLRWFTSSVTLQMTVFRFLT